ncbi:MAG: helix-turn-helix transcriptional regulator [Epsilonproteobacteria bacterium]|nr:helix-turn-helix transcriptional regulator [Campylobacterota bacterium]MBD3840091.1 helix-turn-helix transcriptional regulator [Campylobacterota bacterium]
MHSYDEPVYLISVVATILDIHPQTLRQYEKEGLIEPSRTQGRMRLYSQKDVEQIKLVLQLTRKMGVNLAGVDLIIKLKNQIDSMNKEITELRNELSKVNRNGSVPINKSVVTTTTSYDVIIFGEVK